MRYERRERNGGGSVCAPHNGIGKPVCNVTKTSSMVLNTAAAGVATLTMQLQRCNCFWTCSVRFWSFDNAASSTNRTVLIKQIEVNACAQECGSEAALTAASLDFIGDGRDYQTPTTWYGVPVCWSPWCRQAFAESQTVGFENNDTAAIDFIATNFGTACQAVPPTMECGPPPGNPGFK